MDLINSDHLNFDAFAEAEKVTDNVEDRNKLALILQMKHSKQLHQRILQACDSTFSMTTEPYINVLKEEGFQQVHEEPFSDTEKYYIFWHQDGLLLTMDTCNGQRNSATVYFNSQTDQYLPQCSGKPENGIFVGDFDARTAIRFRLNQLRSLGKFLNPWTSTPYMKLAHWSDWGHTNLDDHIEFVHNKRLNQLPQHIQTAIGIK